MTKLTLFSVYLLTAILLPMAAQGDITLPESGSGRIKATCLTVGAFHLTELSGEISIKDKTINLDKLSAEFCEGGVRGTGVFRLDENPPVFELNLSFFDCKADKLKVLLKTSTPFIAGRLNGSINIRGNLTGNTNVVATGLVNMKASPEDILQTASASITYREQKLTLNDFKGSETGGGSVSGDLELLLPKGGKTGKITGKLRGERVSLASILKVLNVSTDFITGNATGETDICICWGTGSEDVLTSGTLSDVSFEVFKVPVSGTATFDFDGETLAVRNFEGTSSGGTIKASILVDNEGISIQASGEKVKLENLMKSLQQESEISGDTAFSALVEKKFEQGGISGNCLITVENGKLSHAPGIMSIITLLDLPSFGKHEFTSGKVMMDFAGERILIEEAMLKSKKISLKKGSGFVKLDGDMHVRFTIYSESSLLSIFLGKFGSAIMNAINPVTKVFKVDVKGNIAAPEASLVAFGKKIENPPADEPDGEEP